MAERIRVGIIYENNENWIGGTYYIQNLISSLNTLPDAQQPALTILAPSENDLDQIKKLGYAYANYRELKYNRKNLALWKRILNKANHFFTKYDLFPQTMELEAEGLEVVFPAPVGLKETAGQTNIYWIPDFQEQFLPQFFSREEIQNRSQSHRFIAQSQGHVVFSSKDAYNTFGQLFPKSRAKKHILQFAVSHSPVYKGLELADLTLKYDIDKPYFFAPNQFWKHKNQVVILKAINLLKQQGIKDFIVAFSGKEFDYRNPNYVSDLRIFIKENGLEPHVRFLGFIDRNEQLKLMSEAIAIVQPSLFEGWSTVVEDAKSMGQWVIASDLPVHREQLTFNVSFFNPNKSKELSKIFSLGISNGFPKKEFVYDANILKFGSDFRNIINSSLVR